VNDLATKEISGPDGKTIRIEYGPVLENSGETPTRGATYSVGSGLWHGTDSMLAPNEPPKIDSIADPIPVTLGPKSKQGLVRTNIGVEDGVMDAIRDKTAVLYIYGRMDYCDIFKRPHVTKYCFIVGKNTSHLGGEIPFTFCEGKQRLNCTDDECEEPNNGKKRKSCDPSLASP
jgi:hypothetical protein